MHHKDPELLLEFRLRSHCEFCGKRLARLAHPHHVHSRGAGQIDARINLIALGGPWDCNCHGLAHNTQKITREQLLAVVGAREGLRPSQIVRVIHELRRWDQHKPLPPRLSKYLRRDAA